MKQKKNKKIECNKGITLTALVITIVIMLILAGVTINLILGENGIFTTATTAREKYKISEYLDKVELARAGVSVNNMGEVTLDNLINKIYEEKIVPSQAIKKLDEEQAKITTKEGYVFIITADKIEYVGIGEQVETPPNLQEGDITFVFTPNSWTNKNIKIEIAGKIAEQFTLQYSYDAVNWTDYTKAIEIEENKTIYACIRNALGEQGTYTSCAVTKIDKLAPTGSIKVTTTTNTAKVTVTAQDQAETSTNGKSGIKGYYYSKDGGSTYTNLTTEPTYNFTGLNQTKEYNIKVKIEDNAGNQTIISNTGTTTEVAGLTITVADVNTWTNGTKTITINATNSNYSTIRYTTDGTIPTASSTAYTKAFTVSRNCTITAIAFDSTNQVGKAATNTVTKIDKTAPSVPTITYNSGSNTCSWQTGVNITLYSTDNQSQVAYYEVDWDGDGIANTTTGTNFVPWNGYHSCNNRFRAIDGAGNSSEWSSVIHIHQDTELPVHVNWWYGTYNASIIQLYIQVTDNVGISKVQVPTSTAIGGYGNWVWIDTVWDATANAYRADIYPSTWGHYGTTYLTHLYIYDYAGNGGYYNQASVYIPTTRLYLYNNGDQCASVTGGWRGAHLSPYHMASGATFSLGSDAMYQKNVIYGSYSCVTSSKVYIPQGYTKMYVSIKGSGLKYQFGLTDEVPFSQNGGWSLLGMGDNYSTNSYQVFSGDISQFANTYKYVVVRNDDYEYGGMYVNAVWFE